MERSIYFLEKESLIDSQQRKISLLGFTFINLVLNSTRQVVSVFRRLSYSDSVTTFLVLVEDLRVLYVK